MSRFEDNLKDAALGSHVSMRDVYDDEENDFDETVEPYRKRRSRTRAVEYGLYIILGLFLIASVSLAFFGSGYPSLLVTSLISQTPWSNESVSMKKPLVKKVTAFYGRGTWTSSTTQNQTSGWLERSMKTQVNQARSHNHDQVISTIPLFGNVLQDAYSKIGALMYQNYLEMHKEESQRATWLFWFDADTIVLNNFVSLDSFVSDLQNKPINLVFTADALNGLQAGAFFIRVGEWTSVFLSTIISVGRPKPLDPMWFREQQAMGDLLKDREFFRDKAVEVPQKWFDAYPAPDAQQRCSEKQFKAGEELPDYYLRPGYFMVHNAGTGKYRPGCYDYLLNLAEGSDPAWHNQTAAIEMQNQISAFWKDKFKS